MERYLFFIRKTDRGWTTECPAFGVTADEMEARDSVESCRRMCAEKGRGLLLKGERLPEDVFSGITEAAGGDGKQTGDAPEGTPIYAEIALSEKYKAELARPVPRTVSIPMWLDRQLSKSGINASAVFREALIAKLDETESGQRGIRHVSGTENRESDGEPCAQDTGNGNKRKSRKKTGSGRGIR